MLEILTTWNAAFDKRTLLDLLESGGTGVRLIAKGFSPDDLRRTAEEILQSVSSRIGSFHLMLDLPGAKPRLARRFKGGTVRNGDILVFSDQQSASDRPDLIPTEFLQIYLDQIRIGHRVFIADGTVGLVVEEVNDTTMFCRAIRDCVLSGGRSMNLPDSEVEYKPFTDTDLASLQAVIGVPLGSVSISMVSSGSDVQHVRASMKRIGLNCPLFSKVETARGVRNIQAIAELSDGIMVARGDLSLEMPLEALATSQSQIIDASKRLSKRIMVATGILSSLANGDLPTIAEISELGLLFEHDIRMFLLGDIVAVKNSAIACRWLANTYANWESREQAVS